MVNLCCGVHDESEIDDLVLDAEAMGDYIFNELEVVGLTLFERIDFICADNCSVNKHLSTLITNKIQREQSAANTWIVIIVGCNSHRLNLARQAYYANPQNSPLIEKVDQLMKKLRKQNNSAKLRNFTHYRPELSNKTRWTTANSALKQYFFYYIFFGYLNIINWR